MEQNTNKAERFRFYALKLAKKQQLTKNTFSLELEVPEDLKDVFRFEAGQYIPIKYEFGKQEYVNDYSMTSAPFESRISLGIKVNSDESSVNGLISKNTGDTVWAAAPRGRFTLVSRPHEFRTILGFAAGIGITPLLSHFKNILHNEPRTRLFLFYGNRSSDDIAFRSELDDLVEKFGSRLQVFYFLSRERPHNHLFFGRIDEHKLQLIINQILHLDDTDEESTIWDAVDEVLICGQGQMIRALANACYENGIPKKNIHFELFEAFNEDIFPQEKEFPLVENIEVTYRYAGEEYTTTIPDNKNRLLQQLLEEKFPVPYSCKSGICGSCICQLEYGDVELLENEYLTEKEEQSGKILACMTVPLSRKIKLNFDII